MKKKSHLFTMPLKPLQPSVAFLQPMKTSENLLSGVTEKQH